MVASLLSAASGLFGSGGPFASAPKQDNRSQTVDGRATVSFGNAFQVGGVGNSANPSTGATATGSMPTAGSAAPLSPLVIVAALGALVLVLLIPSRSRKRDR